MMFKNFWYWIVYLFVGTGEKEDKTSADKTAEVCSEATTTERRGKRLYQTTSRKYAQH